MPVERVAHSLAFAWVGLPRHVLVRIPCIAGRSKTDKRTKDAARGGGALSCLKVCFCLVYE